MFQGEIFVGMETARVAAGEPVYWYGLAERKLFGAWLLRLAVLTAILLRSQQEPHQD